MDPSKQMQSSFVRMKADFSPLFDQTSGLVQWSPDGRYMATAVGQRLVVRDATQCHDIIKGGRKPFQDKIEALEWASDSDLLLCAIYKRSLVEVSSISRPEWRCRIREGMAGLVRAQWAPDARHVITFSDFNLYMSVWSLTTRQMHTVRQPKAAPGCLAFSPDSEVMAVATRRDCRDIVRLFSTSNWESLGEFTAETLDLCNLEWSPDGSALCLQDTSLEYRMLFYSPAGELLGRLEAYSNALGVKHSMWSPDGKLLSIGSYDQCARLVSPVTWKPVAILKHTHPRTRPDGTRVACFREVPLGCEREDSEVDKENDVDLGCSVIASSVRSKLSLHAPSVSSFAKGRARGGKDAACSVSRHLTATSTLKPRISGKGVDITYALSLPGPIPEQKPSLSKPFPRLGVGQLMSWSSDGRYLATRNDNMASSVWVWDAEDLALSSLVVQLEAVRSAKWCPTRNTLAICTGNNHVYFWTAEGASWVDAPLEDMEIIGFRWSPDGKALLLLSKDHFCCCFLKDSDEWSHGQEGEESCEQEDDVGSRIEAIMISDCRRRSFPKWELFSADGTSGYIPRFSFSWLHNFGRSKP